MIKEIQIDLNVAMEHGLSEDEFNKIIEILFNYLSKKANKHINKEALNKDTKERAIADFIAGMTDRYAINLYRKLK